MSSEEIAKGATEGVLNWTKKEIISLAKKFRNKGIIFIKDEQIIEEIKENEKSSEFKLFKQYVKDKDLQVLFKMGLILRKIEKDSEKTKNLKDKLQKKFKTQGIHFAFFVQNMLFTKYHASLIERFSESIVKEEINSLSKNIDKYSSFISSMDKTSQKVSEITTKINANSPETFIISSWKNDANKICKKAFNKIIEQISNRYTHSDFSEKNKSMYMIIRKN